MRVEQGVKFAIVPEWVLDYRGLSDKAKILYAVLSRYGNSEGAECRPSRAELGRRMGVSARTITTLVAELQEKDCIRVSRGGGEKANIYHLRQAAPWKRASIPPGSGLLPTESKDREKSPPEDELALVRSAQGLVQEAINTLRDAGVEIVGKSYAAKLGGITKRLLTDYDFEIVQAATINAMTRGRGPEAIPNLCIEIQRLKPATRVRRFGIGLTPEEILEKARSA